MNLNELTIKEARLRLDKGEISSQDLTKACLDQIERLDADLNACLLVSKDQAMAEAREADLRIAKGEKGALLGIPYLCKDNIMTKGLRTTAASKILENYIAPYDASAILKLKKAGAVLLGKTNLDEFAHGASTENSAFGPTKNPHDLSRVAGGSSGGSAAAVAANMCLFALGSDTGGSIRQPASFCGVFGLKPSYGRISRFGLLSMTSSTDVLGPIAKSASDAALVFSILGGVDSLDASSTPVGYIKQAKETIDYNSPLLARKKSEDLKKAYKNKDLSGISIGLPKEYFSKNLDKKIRKKVKNISEKLEARGAKVVEISLPHSKYAIAAYYIITPSEISSNLARFDGIAFGLQKEGIINLNDFYQANRGEGFGKEAKLRIMLGTYALSAGYYEAYYKKAQAVRTYIIKDFNLAFKKVDFILTPTSPHPAFKLGEQSDTLDMYLEDVFVSGVSLAGLPATSIPIFNMEVGGKELPLGMQIIAPRFFDEELLAFSDFIEKNISEEK